MFDPTQRKQGVTAAPIENIDYQKLRLDGVYKQNEKGDLMLRIKVPAGVLSVPQALQVCAIAERFASGELHLTTRGSIELHNLKHPDLDPIARSLAAVGLTSRGACGGAVRGIACSTTFSPGFHITQALVRRLHRHFAGNPHFEGLPKKFKIGVDSGYRGARHLIQDAGLVHVGSEGNEHFFDVWLAGGLGREPHAGFLYAEKVPENALIPLIEAAIRVFRKHVPAGKRFKHLVRALGEKRVRELVAAERSQGPSAFDQHPLEQNLTAAPTAGLVEVPVFAGELQAGALRRLTAVAEEHGDGFLALTADQNVAFVPGSEKAREQITAALAQAGFGEERPEKQVPFRICPGSHACRLGLAPTREVARQVLDALGEKGLALDWAISGCPNSCAQPQLAQAGILATKFVPDEEGQRRPLYALYRRREPGLGEAVAQNLTLEELLKKVEEIG
jgi:sulfite reductase (ferredoxin)